MPNNSHFSETARLPLVIALMPQPINAPNSRCVLDKEQYAMNTTRGKTNRLLTISKYIFLPSSKVEISKMFT